VTARLVIVGYDGSEGAQHAVEWAARTAAALGTSLCIVHAVGLLEHAGLRGGAAVDSEVPLKLARAAGLDPGRVEWKVEDGDPCTALLRVAEKAEKAEDAVSAGQAGAAGPATLLVVGSRGAGAHAGTVLGSTSLELAEHASVPVTIVPPSSG
jgi:nucleotide-binding universal stress UspA family protein